MKVFYFGCRGRVIDHGVDAVSLVDDLAVAEEKVFRWDEVGPGGLAGFVIPSDELQREGGDVDVDRSQEIITQWDVVSFEVGALSDE